MKKISSLLLAIAFFVSLPLSCRATTEQSLDCEELPSLIEESVEDVLASLDDEATTLIEKVFDYDSYVENYDEIDAFYETICATSSQLCTQMQLFAADYAQAIINATALSSDTYDELEKVYDLIYDDMGDDIYNRIYDGVLEDLYDAFYDGALDDSDAAPTVTGQKHAQMNIRHGHQPARILTSNGHDSVRTSTNSGQGSGLMFTKGKKIVR